MRKTLITGLLLGVFAVGAGMYIGTRRVHAQDQTTPQPKPCDLTTLSGAYGYTLNGSVYDNQGYVYLLGAAGRLVPDANGNFTGTDTYSFDGTIVKRQYTGTYTMNGDCTGSVVFTVANGPTNHADIVAVNNGKEINLVQTDGGYIVTATLKLLQQ